jgi:peptide/nickel transport system permease protein
MVSENEVGISLNVWGVAAPCILIALLTVGMNTFTDAVARVTIGIEGRDNVVSGTDIGIRR